MSSEHDPHVPIARINLASGQRHVDLCHVRLSPDEARDVAQRLVELARTLDKRAVPLSTDVVWIGEECAS